MSLIGYLEWSENHHLFLFQAEADIFSKLFTDPKSVVHPFILLPIMGQMVLLITLFQNKPNTLLTYISIGGLGILLGFMFVIGLVGFHFKILCSTIPFLVIAIYTIAYHKYIS